MVKVGVIGGSGLYDIEGLHDRHWQKVETPWGEPSDELLSGRARRHRMRVSCRGTGAGISSHPAI